MSAFGGKADMPVCAAGWLSPYPIPVTVLSGCCQIKLHTRQIGDRTNKYLRYSVSDPSLAEGRSAGVIPCPLYPRKRTCAVHLPMSAKGQKRTSGDLRRTQQCA